MTQSYVIWALFFLFVGGLAGLVLKAMFLRRRGQ